jgi:hypothetical protein
MALNFYEDAMSRDVERTVDDGSVTLIWTALYSMSEVTVYNALVLLAPLTWDGFNRQQIKVSPLGGGVWRCTVVYGLYKQDITDDTDPLGPEFQFDTTGGNVHITQSLATLASVGKGGINLTTGLISAAAVAPDGWTVSASDIGLVVTISGPSPPWTPGNYTVIGTAAGQWTLSSAPAPLNTAGGLWNTPAPNYHKAIGVTKDSVEGTDIYAAKLEFTITFSTGPGVGFGPLGWSYIRALKSLTAKVNSTPFRGFQPGEVLFMGANGTCGPDNIFKITLKFAVSENQVNVAISPEIMLPSVQGWAYKWVSYKPSVSADFPVTIPAAAYVEQVYRTADFSLLGIGA